MIRSKQSSVQLSTYSWQMAMYRLRQTVQRKLGDTFSLGRYHEAVLEPGAVPLRMLPDRFRAAYPKVIPLAPRLTGPEPPDSTIH